MNRVQPTPNHPRYEEYITNSFIDTITGSIKKWNTKVFILETACNSHINQLIYKRGVANE